MASTHEDPRLIEVGTETPFGVTERQTVTGWFMTDGSFVPFVRMEPARRVVALIRFA